MGDIEKRTRGWSRRHSHTDRPKESKYALAPFGAVYVGLLGLGTVGALVVYLLLIAFVPGASVSRLDAMKTALLVVAGSGAGAGLYVQYRKQQTDEARSALDHSNSRRDQDKLFTERYTQAVAQLGSQAPAVRLGGVYALARIADDSKRDRPTCLKVLCAYLRMPYDPDDTSVDPAEYEVRTTAQAIIWERLRPEHPGFWPDAQIDLRRACLIHPEFADAVIGWFNAAEAMFVQGAAFNGATFTESAVFVRAAFTGPAYFSDTTFAHRANFGEARFNADARFDRTKFAQDTWFGGATFNPKHPPVWPEGFSEPLEIIWEPSVPLASTPDPNLEPSMRRRKPLRFRRP